MSTFMDKYIDTVNNIKAEWLEKFYPAFLYETGLKLSEAVLVEKKTKDKMGYIIYFEKRDKEE